MKAEIITIGDEILIGQIVDTNSQWIGKELNSIGVSVYQITSIQDEKQHILKSLKEAENRADIILITGGLGPTKDDITKKTIAEYFNDTEIKAYPKVFEHITELLKKHNVPVSKVQQFQAELPSKATMLFNHFGTAPGMWFEENNTIFVSMPGVPTEMKGLMESEVLPRLQEKFNLPFIKHTTIYTYGQGESIIAERIAEVENNLPDFVKLAYLPSGGKVRLRLSGKHKDKTILERTISDQVSKIKSILSDIIFGIGDNETAEKTIGKLLTEKGLTLATAESMTGGKLASTIVSVSGASAYYKGSFITYTAELKQELLNVPKEIIEKHSVVSKQVAEIMATNVLQKTKTDIAISITGNAGPTTDKNTTDVGLVYIGIAQKQKTEVLEFNFGQPREKVIERTVNKSLELLGLILKDF